MKIFLILAVFFTYASTYADTKCDVLQSVNGNYIQTSDSCLNDTNFTGYKYVEVTSVQIKCEKDKICLQTWIMHTAAGHGTGGVGAGPTNQSHDLYKCDSNGSNVTVEDPRFHDYWNFSKASLTYMHGQCVAIFQKVN